MTGFDLSTITGCYVGSTPATAIYYGSSKIWPATQHDYSQDYFTIVSLEDNNDILFRHGDTYPPGNGVSLTIYVSIDGGSTWTAKASSINGTVLATLNEGENIIIKGSNNSYCRIGNQIQSHYFDASKTFNVAGNILSLIYDDNFIGQTSFPSNSEYNFDALFQGSTSIVSASNLILPATTLTSCCYERMFYGCSSLTSAPALPAQTLISHCYNYMFYGCSSLTSAPILPAKTLINYCYHWMFYNCSSLNYIKCLATDISASGCLDNWAYDLAASGTFVKDANTTWPTGSSGIPSGWTVVDAA